VKVLVLQHVACEPAAAYGEALHARGVEATPVALDTGGRLPPWTKFDGVLAMGGPMSVNDELPWLLEEQRLVGDAVRAGKAFLGICLGAQLLAAALGATVRAGPAPEIGVHPVRMTAAAADDPVLGRLPAEVVALHWHGDTFDLPDGAVLLASTAAYAHQAFRCGPRAYGIQFHLEAPAALVRAWGEIAAYRAGLERAPSAVTLARVLAATRAHEDEMLGHARDLIGGWVERCLVPSARDAAAGTRAQARHGEAPAGAPRAEPPARAS